ncbi:MAG: aryl-sulfate sulfotransferase [bacterium]|nr:aryl-sulfate sulfotransferase [bacterium]
MRFSQLRHILVFVFIFIVFVAVSATAQHTVGLLKHDGTGQGGYTIFGPRATPYTILIDEYGRVVHTWVDSSMTWGGAPYLLENGDLLRNEGGANRLLKYDWDGNVIWDWSDPDPSYGMHHDIAPMPNGNVLILVRDYRPIAEAIADGKDTVGIPDDTIWAEMVLEIQQTGPTSGDIVWRWTCYDHLIQDFDATKNNFGVVEDHPELMDFNYGALSKDWLHANGLDYNPDLDQIMISNRRTSELWIVDHSTTTAEAATNSGGNSGMGGNILYRWGNPAAYRAGDSTDMTMDGQHDTQWIKPGLPGAGNILAFSNGRNWGFSTGVEAISTVDVNGNYPLPGPGVAHEPAAPVWTYSTTPPEDYFATAQSGIQRLPNGNTILTHAPNGEFREVTPAGEIVWQYQSPLFTGGSTVQGAVVDAATTFKTFRYQADYPGLAGKVLVGDSVLEINPVSIKGATTVPAIPAADDAQIAFTASITADVGLTSASLYVDTGDGFNMYPLVDGLALP